MNGHDFEQSIGAGEAGEPGRVRFEAEEFPTDPMGMLSNLLRVAGIGPKRWLVLGEIIPPHPGEYATTSEIVGEFNELYRGTPMAGADWKTIIGSYCQASLCEVGLVAQAYELDHAGVQLLLGFGLTEAGAKYLPALAVADDFERRRKISLFEGLGKTGSRFDLSAPYVRARLLLFLYERGGQMIAAEAVDSLGFGSSAVYDNLSRLQKARWIEYKAVNTHTGEVQVGFEKGTLARDEVRPVRRAKTLTGIVADIGEELSNRNENITQARVFELLPGEVKSRWKVRELRKMVNHILSGLAEQGYLQRGKYRSGEVWSEVKLTDRGGLVVEEFLQPMVGLVTEDGSTWARVRTEVLPRVKANASEGVAVGAELYYPHSQAAKIKESRRVKQNIVAMLGEVGGDSWGFSAKQLAARVNRAPKLVGVRLGELIAQGVVVRVEKNGVYYYRLRPEEE